MTAHGLPDIQKSARIMLKDYVNVCCVFMQVSAILLIRSRLGLGNSWQV
jgi:hypothetical protein